MKIKTSNLIIFFFILGCFLVLPSQTKAEDKPYTLLAPLPCLGGSGTPGTEGYNPDCGTYANQTTLEKYIPGVFNLAIGISAAFVLLNLVFGGFQYMSSDAFTKKEEGIKRIENSIKGLLLVVGAWLILYTINPKLLNVSLSIETIETPAGGGITAGTTCTTCVPLDSALPIKAGAGTSIAPAMNSKLVSLNGSLKTDSIAWQITEAYPATYGHLDPCHSNGTCVDAVVNGMTTPNTANATNIQKFVRDARQSGVSFIQMEVKTPGEVTAWAALGVVATLNPGASAPHFHIEN